MSVLSQLGQQLIVQSIKQYLPDVLATNESAAYVLSIGNDNGGVNFAVEDMPAEVKLGGEQVLAVHKYAGGGIDVQSMGAFDDPVSWSGTFTYTNADSGDTALTRALKLNAMRVQGQQVTLVIGTMQQDVMISKFSFVFANEYSVHYDIELQPVSQLSQQATSSTTSDSSLNTTLAATVGTTSIVKNSSGQALISVTTAAATTTLAQILYDKAVGNSSLAAVAVAAAVATQSIHIVASGDTLFKIAKSAYGDGTLWTTIAKANSISNPISIVVGQKLIVPSQTGS